MVGIVKKGQVDMLHGPLWGKIIVFALPLIASGILQQSFNAIDVAIVGRFCDSNAIAAVGSNGPIITIMVNLFLGIAVGANVVIANYLGRKDDIGVHRAVSTVMIIALLSGFLLLIMGTTLARPILQWMSAPPEVIDLASEYLRIYFCGMPFMMIYNFGNAIVRSIGDTKKPFYALLFATATNFVLDWLFTGVMGWGVAGVAWATVIANAVNAAVMVFFLLQAQEPVTLHLNKWSISWHDFGKMLQIGIPAGLQGMVFSISNIFIQSSINRFGPDAIAGSAAALTYEAYCYFIVVAFCSAAIAFTGQNYGAGNAERCKLVFKICLAYSIIFCALANVIVFTNQERFIALFTSDPNVAEYAYIRFRTALVFQCIACTYEVSGSYMRGFGYSVLPMILTILGTCIFRLIWVAVFPSIDYSFKTLLTVYPITWCITGVMVLTAALIVQRKVLKGLKPDSHTDLIKA